MDKERTIILLNEISKMEIDGFTEEHKAALTYAIVNIKDSGDCQDCKERMLTNTHGQAYGFPPIVTERIYDK